MYMAGEERIMPAASYLLGWWWSGAWIHDNVTDFRVCGLDFRGLGLGFVVW